MQSSSDSLFCALLNLLNYRNIGWWKRVLIDHIGMTPHVICNPQMLHLSRDECAREEKQQHILFGIAMKGHLEDIHNRHLNPTFLSTLSNQGCLWAFSSLEFSSGKLPFVI